MSPSRHGDAPWLATRAVSNATIVIYVARCNDRGHALTVFCARRRIPRRDAPTPAAAGALDGPTESWVTSNHRSYGTDAGCCVERDTARSGGSNPSVRMEPAWAKRSRRHASSARRGGNTTVAVAHIGNRGRSKSTCRTAGDVELELACSKTRACARSVELWSCRARRCSASCTAMAAMLMRSLRRGLVGDRNRRVALREPGDRGVARVGGMGAALWAEAGPSAFLRAGCPAWTCSTRLASSATDARRDCRRSRRSRGRSCSSIGIAFACIGLRSWRVSR